MAELAHDSPNGKLEGEGLAWEDFAKDARYCLETCRNIGVLNIVFSVRLMLTDMRQLHIAEEHGDGSILEHVNKLIESLEKRGYYPHQRTSKTTVGGKTWMRTVRRRRRRRDVLILLWSLPLDLHSGEFGYGSRGL